MTGRTSIDIYPVGVLMDAKHAWGAARIGQWDHAKSYVRRIPRRLRDQVRARNWRSLKNSFNGYLAEISYPPAELVQHTCGHGWTKRRAARRMGEYLARDNKAQR